MTGREDSRQSCSRAAGSRRAWGLDGTALKYIAMVSMLIDHIGAVVMEYLVFYRGGLHSLQPILHSPEGAAIYRGIRLLRMLGRGGVSHLLFSPRRRLSPYQKPEEIWYQAALFCFLVRDPL